MLNIYATPNVWYTIPMNLIECHRIANELVSKYPGHSIFSLGQSPAWIIKTIGINHYGVKTEYIPFSGNIFSHAINSNNTIFSDGHNNIRSFSIADRPAHEKQYRKVLTALNLNPKEIIKQAKEGKKTVIVEYTETYGGLISFFSVLALWALELKCLDELKNSLIICVLPRQYSNARTKMEFYIESTLISFPLENIQVNGHAMGNMGNGIDKGPLADRLVPHYSRDEWHELPILSTEHAHTLSTIESLLRCVKPDPNVAFKNSAPVIFTDYPYKMDKKILFEDFINLPSNNI